MCQLIQNVTANSFDVEITEQDNGGTAGVFRDAGFSFYIPLGNLVVCLIK